MTTFTLTTNETDAALALVAYCLRQMGGNRPMDLENDPLTWVYPDVLIDAGWSRHEAAGTWSALLDKGVIYSHGVNEGIEEWVLADPAWRWLDGVWEAYAKKAYPDLDNDHLFGTA